jgi:hypothetical protein
MPRKGKTSKKYSPPSPQSAKAAQTTRASKRAVAARNARPKAQMAGVPADVSRRPGEEEDKPADMEQEMVVDPAQHGAGSVPAGNFAANLPEGHNGPGGERPDNINDEVRDQADASRNAGGSSGPDRSTSPPGGGGDDRCRQNDRHTEARERAMMKALHLIKESNEVLQLADGHPGVRLVGQSKEDARRLLNNVKACRMEFLDSRR